MTASEKGTEHPDARTSPDEEELADPTTSDEELIGVDEARERSGGDSADDADSTTEHDRAEGFS